MRKLMTYVRNESAVKWDSIIGWVERHLFLLTLFFCILPYIGIIIYLRIGMHATEKLAAIPSGWFLGILAFLGILVPLCGLTMIVRQLIHERHKFRLQLLLHSYISLILIFASSFALLQVSSENSAFSGMAPVWKRNQDVTLGFHVNRIHTTFLNSLYLSIITITTVGYGDITPSSPLAKVLAALESLVGIGFMGIAIGYYFSVRTDRD